MLRPRPCMHTVPQGGQVASTIRKGRTTMKDNELLDKIISLTENVVKLKIENERLKVELKHERELNRFMMEHPNMI